MAYDREEIFNTFTYRTRTFGENDEVTVCQSSKNSKGITQETGILIIKEYFPIRRYQFLNETILLDPIAIDFSSILDKPIVRRT